MSSPHLRTALHGLSRQLDEGGSDLAACGTYQTEALD